MPTKYDIFAKIIEKAPCRIKDLGYDRPTYAHISNLKSKGWIQKKNNKIYPVKNQETTTIFQIIKYCLNHGLNYNLLLKKSMKPILKNLPQSLPELRPKPLKNKKEILDILKYLEKNQFILKYSKKPAKGRMLKHQVFDSLCKLHKIKLKIKTIDNPNLTEKILKIKTEPLNPFEKKTFSFLTGSVQLEGSTITEGDTEELLLHDIYPDKPAKDIQMVKNLNEALKYILDNKDSDITPEKIKEINKQTMFSLHANAGKYKITQNKIQGNPSFKTARPEEVSKLMQEFCDYLRQIPTKEACLKKIGEIHNSLQRIHPFSDGNSRTTRMLLNWILIKHDLPIIILKMGIFDEYMSLTKLSSKRDDETLNSLFLEAITHENLKK
ncbi:MAG: Fic family protein [archaeon]